MNQLSTALLPDRPMQGEQDERTAAWRAGAWDEKIERERKGRWEGDAPLRFVLVVKGGRETEMRFEPRWT